MESKKIIHPRPSSIVAAMYTLRDLGVDLIVLHGPPGCSFKHSRLLEEENVNILTSAMGENDFVFGGEKKLVETINKGIKKFEPDKLAVVGTCVSMIIGENLESALEESEAEIPSIEVGVHSGYEDNTTGVIKTLEAAEDSGFITENELERQKKLLKKATEVEKKKGSAKKEYVSPSSGDPKGKTAKRIIKKLEENKDGLIILNAKKETSYVFSDIVLALNIISEDLEGDLVNVANLDPEKGLEKVKNDAKRVKNELESKNVEIDFLTGGLDEYAATSDKVKDIIKNQIEEIDFYVVLGVPHAIELPNNDKDIISVTNGPREVEPLRDLGHDFVILEKDLHTKSMGKRSITKSRFGEEIRKQSKNLE